MVAGMRTDLHSAHLPLQPFGAVHQGFDGDTFGFIPIICAADLLAHGIAGRTKTIVLQNGQGVREVVLLAIIERDAENLALLFAAEIRF